jgi:hypothetical protein
MTSRATTKFTITNWDEKPYDVVAGQPKLTRASISQAYAGDIEGEGKLEYLMVYGENGSASYVGLERVTGRIGGRSGSYVAQTTGTFEGSTAKGTFIVVPGSGTGELAGLRGSGSFIAVGGQPDTQVVTLDYEIAAG